MKIHNVEQNSEAWYKLRAGIPTASAFDRIITPKGKLSSQAADYQRDLVSEIMSGIPIDEKYQSKSMKRGHALEEEAAGYYALINGVELQKVGFITDDLGRMGCSPDRLVGDDGLLEIKCPDQQTMIGYYLLSDEKLQEEYWVQKQSQLLVSGRQWVDNLFYHESPRMTKIITRVTRSEFFIGQTKAALNEFFKGMNEMKAKLEAKGYVLPAHPTDEPVVSALDAC